jgi:hypothetical protein
MTEGESNLRVILKRILRALRAVLISEMDYQVELEEMKPSRFKLIFIVLITATVTWAAAFYTSWGYIPYIGIALLAGWTIFILTWLTRSKG